MLCFLPVFLLGLVLIRLRIKCNPVKSALRKLPPCPPLSAPPAAQVFFVALKMLQNLVLTSSNLYS